MSSMSRNAPYRLDDQIGFILRQANQRYAALFANGIGNGRGLARLYAALALGGEVDGVRLLSERTARLPMARNAKANSRS